MDAIFAMLGIGLVIMIFVGSIMGIVAGFSIGHLQRQIHALKRQVELLQQPRTQVEALETVNETPPSVEPEHPPDIPSSIPVLSPQTPNISEPTETLEHIQMATPTALKSQKPLAGTSPDTAQAKRSFEEMLGAQWSVWVGGLALLLGAVFLLRYTIEAGFFSPAIRVIMAALFGLILLIAGEFLRRGDSKIAKKLNAPEALADKAYIPGVLTAVGIFALLGSTYAAYALYGFIGPETAFTVMGVLSLCGLGFGLLHGPSLAALGLLASLVTPLLIQTTAPNVFILFTYLTIVSFSAIALAMKRDWGWLTGLTLFGALAWLFVSLEATTRQSTHFAWLAFAGLTYATSTLLAKTPEKTAKITSLVDKPYGSTLACIWAAFAALLFLIAASLSTYDPVHFSAGLIFCGVLMMTAWVKPEQSWHIISGGVLGGLIILLKAGIAEEWLPYFAMTIALIAVFLYLCYSRLSHHTPADRNIRETIWPLSASIWPIFLCLSLTSIVPTFEKAPGLTLYGLAVIFVYLSSETWKKDNRKPLSAIIFSFGAAVAFVFACFMTWSNLSEILALVSGLVIWSFLSTKLPKTPNRMITAGLGIITLLNALFNLLIGARPVAQTVIINELWIYFAVPALICAASAYWLSRDYDDLWSEGLKALALTFTALFFILQIRHAMNGGDLLADRFSFDEMALQVLVGLSFTLGGSLIAPHQNSVTISTYTHLIPTLAMGVSLFTILVFVLGLCLSKAPLFSEHIPITGHILFNNLILAYLIPAVMFAAIAALSRGRRPDVYVKLTGSLSLLAALFYLTSQIRRGFSGTNLSIFKNKVEGLELYTISAAWLVLGIAILAVGLRAKSKSLRLGSATVIILTVLKAFLIDMASLEGVLRAVSFVVLGLVLIVIGRAYQRILVTEKISGM